MKNHKGFSLVELIVVIAVLTVLTAVAVPTFASFIRKAKEASDISYMHDIEYAIRLAHAQDPEVNIILFTVYVDSSSGHVEDITYTIERDLYADEVYSHKAGNDDNATPIIDWEYDFKALETVRDNENWQEHWEIVEIASEPDDYH